MTDNDIIKALECCFDGYCEACAFDDNLNLNCKDRLIENALNLIERQKAEIERMQAEKNVLKSVLDKVLVDVREAKELYVKDIEKAKTEAIKEFWESLKEIAYIPNLSLTGEYIVDVNDGDNLVKEMTE